MSLGHGTHEERETVYDWAAALLAIVLTGIHLYLGFSGAGPRFLVVGGLFAVGILFFFTGYWRTVVYLLAAVYVATLGVLWFLGGMEYREIGLLTGTISTAFLVLVVYLFVRESSAG